MLTRSYLDRLTAPGAFLWAAGIERTFITDSWRKTTRTLDEEVLIDHDERRDADRDLVASPDIMTADGYGAGDQWPAHRGPQA